MHVRTVQLLRLKEFTDFFSKRVNWMKKNHL